MPYQFQMRFAGLCAFVPEKAPGFDENRVHVLLVNPTGSSARRLLSRKLRKHAPLLRFSLKNLAGVNGAAGNLENVMGTRELDGLDLTLCLRTRGTRTDEPLDDGGVQIFSNTGVGVQDIKPLEYTVQERDFAWLPCMDEVLPGAEINRAFLEDFSEVGPIGDGLAARVQLDAGTLRTDAISRHQEDAVVFQFIPSPFGGTFVRQAMAHWAALDVEVDDDCDVVIRAQTFGTSESKLLVLRPSGTEDVRVDISNLCCGHYIEDGAAVDESEVTAPEPEEDFEAYFLLCEDPQGLKDKCGHFPIPVPVHFSSKPNGALAAGEGGGQGTDCQMARFSSLYKSPVDPTGPPDQTDPFPTIFLPQEAQSTDAETPAPRNEAAAPRPENIKKGQNGKKVRR